MIEFSFRQLLPVFVLAQVTSAAVAQDSLVHDPVPRLFAGHVVVNAQSVDLMPKVRGFSFNIQHRFGAFGPDEQVYKQFLGMDLPANIRLGFNYSPTKWLQIDLGRTKSSKAIDLGAKVRLMLQTTDNHSPLSISAYLDASVMTDDFPALTGRDFYPDSVTPFTYKWQHRFRYQAQVIVGRRMTRWLSVQVAPVVVWRNLAAVGGSNLAITVVTSIRFKVSPKGSILLDYPAVVYGRQATGHLDPMSIAYEVATQGHVFQILLSTTTDILEQYSYHEPAQRYDRGYVLLGFNISRTLLFKPRARKK